MSRNPGNPVSSPGYDSDCNKHVFYLSMSDNSLREILDNNRERAADAGIEFKAQLGTAETDELNEHGRHRARVIK